MAIHFHRFGLRRLLTFGNIGQRLAREADFDERLAAALDRGIGRFELRRGGKRNEAILLFGGPRFQGQRKIEQLLRGDAGFYAARFVE